MKNWTINAIKEAMRAEGSHWFDPDSMQFFGSQIDSQVYQGPGGVYFVSSEKPPHDRRKWSVRQFVPEGADIHTLGTFCGYGSLADAREAAREAAGQAAVTTEEKYHPVDDLEQLQHTLNSHGCKGVTPRVCRQLVAKATVHHYWCEQECNGTAVGEAGDKAEKAILKLAQAIGAGVKFSGDPRGATVKLVMPDGYTDDWGKEGVCVPTKQHR